MSGTSQSDSSPRPQPAARGPFEPLLLLAIAFLGWTAIQTTQLMTDRRSLADVAAQQVAPFAAAQKIRAAADSLAKKMQALADKGNPNAQLVVVELKKRGITINTGAASSAPQ